MSFSNLENKKTKPITKRTNFIEKHGEILEDALCNAINTIKNKPSVKGGDPNSKYYRDHERYSRTLEELRRRLKK